MSYGSQGSEPQPSLAWTFESSNVDYITGLTPSAQVSPGPAQLQGSAALVTNAPTSNTAVYFPGVTSTWMNLGTSTPVNFSTITSNIFIECWVYSSLAYNPNFIIWHQGSAGGQENWSLYFDTAGRLFTSIWGQVSGTATQGGTNVGSAIGLNSWTHVGFAISNTNSVYTNYIYVNGVPTSTSTPAGWTPQYTSTGLTQIGGRNSPSDTTNMYIRDLRVVQGGIVPTTSFTPSAAPFTYTLPSYVTGSGSVVFTLLGQFVTYPSGKYNNSVTIRNYITTDASSTNIVYSSPSYSTTSGLSFSFWVNIDIKHSTAYGCPFSFTSNDATPMYFDFFDTLNGGTVLGIYCQNGRPTPSTNPFTINSSVVTVAGTWYHIALTISSGLLMTLYINGSSSGTPVTLTNGFTLGSYYLGRSGQYNGHSFSGLVDDLRIYSSALTAAQVQSIYTQGGAPASQFLAMPQPALAWQFESSNVDYVTGLSPSFSTVNGSITSAPTYVPGKYGQAIQFNNTGVAYVSNSYIRYNVSIPISSFSICAWINPYQLLGTTQGQTAVSVFDGSANYFSLLGVNANQNSLYLFGQNPYTGPVNIQINGSGTIPTNTWSHWAATFNNGTVAFYFNGVLQGTTTFANTFTVTQIFAGAYWNTGGGFNGSIDDLRVYNTALSATQVKAIYAAQGMPSRIVKQNSSYIKSATGGDTIQTINGYRIHIFTTVGTSTFTPATSGLVDVLVVAGGGGGGYDRAGGGGAGGLIYQSGYSVASSGITVTVGDGGAGRTSLGGNGTNGSNSVFGALTAIGGGGGGTYAAGSSGGSGGGGHGQSTYAGGASTSGQGFAGGYGSGLSAGANSGGGGGAGGSGANGGTTTNATGSGNGGPGSPFDISGSIQYYAGGGGGSIAFDSYSGTSDGGKGGVGGGGNAGQTRGANGSPGTSGTGGGGGGGANIPQGSGGKGGSGIVIVRYPISIPVSGASLFSQLSASAVASSVAAFSLRAINGTTAKAVQVKRSSDNAQQDFYADRLGNLLTAPVTGQTLANWLGGSTGTVVTWYDQSGKGNHATQATAANQPVIQKATKGPGYTTIWPGTAGPRLVYATTSNIFDSTNYSVCVVAKRNAAIVTASQYYAGSNGQSVTNQSLGVGYNNDTQMRLSEYGYGLSAVTVPGYSISNEPMGYDFFTFSQTSGMTINTWRSGTRYTGSDVTLTTPLTRSGNAIIGWSSAAGNSFNGEIYEILVFTSSLYDLDGTNTINQIYQNQVSYTGI
jgi:Concanavalin A-like lectin/glucanases superfamily